MAEDPFEAEIIELLEADDSSFHHSKLRVPSQHYVAWVDIMGAANILSIDYQKATNIIGRFHLGILYASDCMNFKGKIYSFVDGCYIVSRNVDEIRDFLFALFHRFAYSFICDPWHGTRFMVRGAMAYGRVIDGENVREAAKAFGSAPQYIDHLLLGAPVAEANSRERNAAPFGVWISESARQFSPERAHDLRNTHWRWWEYEPKSITKKLPNSHHVAGRLKHYLKHYFVWCAGNSTSWQYKKEAIERHSSLFSEYFSEVEDYPPVENNKAGDWV